MSLRKKYFISLIGLVLVGSFYISRHKEGIHQTDMASVARTVKRTVFRRFAKLDRPMQLQIKDIVDSSVIEPNEHQLRGLLTLQQPIGEQIQYDWVLPTNVQIIAGQQSGSFSTLSQGQQASADITISPPQDSKTPVIAVFEAYYFKNGVRIANSAVYQLGSGASLNNNAKISVQGQKMPKIDF